MDAPNDVRKYNSRCGEAERRFRNHLKKEPPSRSFMETPTSKQKAIAVNHLANHLQQEARAAKPSADGTQTCNTNTCWQHGTDARRTELEHAWFRAREVQMYCNTLDFMHTEADVRQREG